MRSRSALEAFAPIALDELVEQASLQDRVDVKFLVGARVLDDLLRSLAATHRILDIEGTRVFTYETVYFDTPGLDCVRAHLQGRRRRWKIRRRRYVDTARTAIELKVKGRRGRTVKHAHPVDARDGALTDGERAFLDSRLLAAYGRGLEGVTLVPALEIVCRRVTLAAPRLGERVTVDLGLQFASGHRLVAGCAIVECKSPAGASLASRRLRELGVRAAPRCSKYCLGMALARNEVRGNHLLPLLRRHFEPVAATANSSSRIGRSTT